MTPNNRVNRMTDMERDIEARMIGMNMTRWEFWDWYLNPGEKKSVGTVEQDGWTTYDTKTVKF